MNQIKTILSPKFEQPTRKNSDDFNDDDFNLDSDFSFDDNAINNYKIEIDNGQPKKDDDIIQLKKGLIYKKGYG